MNLSRMSNSYSFKDFNNDMFKVQSSNQGIHNRISDSLKQYGDLPNVRLINDWMLLIIRNSMLVWKYTCFQKNYISVSKEYFLPNSEILYSANQGLVICDQVNNKPLSCIIVGDDAVVRFWPDMTSTKEYIDQKIPNIYNDKCILVDRIYNDVLIFMFKSMKFIIADLKDYTDAGISFKQFTQPTGIIGGISRCLTSFFVTNTNQESPFVSIKVNNQLKEDSELLVLVDNNIDSLYLDVLLNGKYTKAIFNHTVIKKAICEKFMNKFSMHLDNWNLTIKNFDFRRDIFYILLEINQFGSNIKTFMMVTYNRRLCIIDSVAEIKSEFEGDIEIIVIDDEIPNVDQPCLITTVKDNHTISIVEVLTGEIKAKFDAHDCLKSNNSVHSTKSILCWTCPKFLEDAGIKVVILTTCKQLVYIKQNINPFYKDISRRQLETNLSNASLQDINNRKFRGINQQGDVDMSNISFSHKTLHPMSLSTPKTKLDQMGDRFAEDSNISINQINFDINQSVNCEDNIDQYFCDKSAFGKFKNCVILFWLGYKLQANRLMASLIEASQVDSEVSISLFVLEIAREIIDEHPIKDPRWLKEKSQPYNNNFCYSTKSLILSQQLASKRAALQNLLMMLHDNNFDLFGAVCNVAPISVYKCLLRQGEKSDLQIYGDCKVSWPLVNCIGFGGELLEFVDVLNKIMANNQCLEIQTILTRTCQHILTTQKKLSPMDIISQEVSLIPTFINECCDYLNGIRDGLLDSENLENNTSKRITNFNKIFHVIAQILFKCLQASLAYRKEFENTFLPKKFISVHAHKSTTAPCWVTENKPIGVSEAVNNLIVNLIDFARNSESSQLFDFVFKIISVYLEFYKHRLEWTDNFSTNDSELDRLFEEYRQNRYFLINKIVEDGKNIKKGLELADEFMDFHWIIALCEILDDESGDSKTLHLEYYLHKFCEEGFSEYVLNWYQDKMNEKIIPQKGKLLAKIQIILEKIQKLEGTNLSTRMENSNSTVVISKFLDKTEDQTTRWLHEIEIEDFGQAAKTLLRSGESEKTSLGRKKTLLSLAKLSCWAAIDDMRKEERERIVNTANGHLKLISFQEDIPPKFVSTLLGYSSEVSIQPLLEVEKLVKLFLESAKSDDNVEVRYIVSALHLLFVARENFPITNLSDSEYNNLLLTVWIKVIIMDRWVDTSPESLESTVISAVINTARDSGIPIETLLPNIDELCSHELLKDKISDSKIEYNIKKSFESLTAHILSPESNSCMVY